MCLVKYRNIVTGLIYEVEEKVNPTGLRLKMEFSRDKVIGYKWL